MEEGKEGIYGRDWMGLVGARRALTCRTRYCLPSGMLPEGITEKVREQEWIPCIPPLVHFPTENRVFVVHGPPAIGGSFFQFSGLDGLTNFPMES